MKKPVRIFLGANSGAGFHSLYGQLLGTRLYDLLIVKGSPGGGKSSFMRAVARELEAAGEETVEIRCSGDPDSLDGVLFPGIRAGIVDGTAPHALEPEFTLAHERYLDLSRFCDVGAVKAAQREIVARSRAYRAAYAAAYRCLRAADAVEEERRAAVRADADRLRRRISGVISRELRGSGAGSEDRAFLGGVTHRGDVCLFDTVDALCPRVYAFADSYGVAAPALEQLRDAALAAGERVLSCPDPDRPRRLQHLLIPGRGLAFVTSNDRIPYPGKPYRRIRLDAMAEDGLTRAEKAKLRFMTRVARSLRESAVDALSRAKAEHDELERLYNPCVDFTGVYALAEAEAERLRGYIG